MEINIIFPNNEEPVIEYKLPDFINENKEIGDNLVTSKFYNI